MEAPSAHNGGVAMLYCVSEQFSVEALQIYDTNVLSFHLASGGHFWYIPGCYLAPYDAFTVADVITEISQRPRVAALLVVGDLNTDLAAPEGRAWDQEIAAAMATSGLEGFSGHFFP